MFEKEQVSLSKLQYGRPDSVGSEVGEGVGMGIGMGEGYCVGVPVTVGVAVGENSTTTSSIAMSLK